MRRKVIEFLRKHWIAMVGSAIAFALGITGSYVDKFILDRPELSVEINSIEKKLPDNFILPPDQYSVIQQMADLLYSEDQVKSLGYEYSSSRDGKFRMEDLDKIAEVLKDKLDREIQRTIDNHNSLIKKLEEAPASGSADLPTEIRFELNLHAGTAINQDQKASLIKRSRETVQTLEAQKSEYARKLPEIELTLAKIRESFSTIEVSTVVVNSGKSSVSLKSQALLRVNIGANNFIELPMRMIDFDNKSEIPTQGARVIRFASRQMVELDNEDKYSVHQYWGQVAPSTLFLLDIFNKTHQTKPIVFSSGLYEKNTYNLLKEASKKLM